MTDAVAIAQVCGDTFIDFRTMSPVDQWERILAALRANGFDVYADGSSPPDHRGDRMTHLWWTDTGTIGDIRPAFRADRLRADGWETCGTCLGHGQTLDTLVRSRDPNRSAIFDQEPCPVCAHGLVPPDRMIEAAAKAIYDYAYGTPWEDGGIGSRTDCEREARAALVAAARWVPVPSDPPEET